MKKTLFSIPKQVAKHRNLHYSVKRYIWWPFKSKEQVETNYRESMNQTFEDEFQELKNSENLGYLIENAKKEIVTKKKKVLVSSQT